MIKTKSALLVLMTTVAFTGCGSDIPLNDAGASDVLVEESEACIEVLPSFETTRLIFTTSTTQSTTATTTTTAAATTTALTTTTEAQTEIETQTEVVTEPEYVEPEPTETSEEFNLDEPEPYVEPQEGAPGALIRSGMRGTYYAPGSWNGYSATGGSGRALLDGNYGGDGYAKGSIASGYLYNLLGYYANDGRTTVWLYVDGYPEMNGLYYLDDCSGADVIDFFYNANSNCQFSWAGVVSVDVYYAN